MSSKDSGISQMSDATLSNKANGLHSFSAECGNHMSSKDSGISQMSDATLSNKANGVPNGHLNA
ncbi:hypothetical protein OBRU01_05556 [Operophtera brumata]|uniref:Uncharacterized protein n=1 Tax=Operophtera brumata TaxID=104452 RepID=A0A0L7LM64_OPEBR|nr:hypothetical protein OBRU01_05556 [Operophtera brumata]